MLLRSTSVAFMLCFLVSFAGCGPSKVTQNEKRPRPVKTVLLGKTPPPTGALLTGSVGSWKDEQIGFEVAGRVEFVAEQNTSIEGRIRNEAGESILTGTPIARLESERFELQVARARSDVERAEQNLVAAKTELNDNLEAQLASAVASASLAKTEYDRTLGLKQQRAVSQAEVDIDFANRESAVARVRQLDATILSKKAEIKSLISAVDQAKQGERDAERNLEDCTLYSSFSGQVASVTVVPGSVVKAGEPIVTLQMMDPIKVELEVSAERSKQLRRTAIYPVLVTMPDGEDEIHDAFLHQVDSVADPQLRTYTVTFLVLNTRLTSAKEDSMATTDQVWRLDLPFLPGGEKGQLLVEKSAILEDADGFYLWQITNATIQTRQQENVFDVKKIRITPQESEIPFLGSYIFKEVVVHDPDFDATKNLVVGELNAGENPEQWNGTQVVVDSGSRWMLRPGDLVKVDLSSTEVIDGYFLPLTAIARGDRESAIFVLDESQQQTRARRIAVKILDGGQDAATSRFCHFEPVDEISLEGLRCITHGVHYLVDGEPVNAAASAAEVSE